MSIIIKSGKKDEIINVKEDIKIDADQINEALIEQPSKYAWYGFLYSSAKEKYENLKTKLLKIEKDLDTSIREDSEYSGKKKPAETTITKLIHGNEVYLTTSNRVNQARKEMDALASVLKALDQRMDTLITLCANSRAEQKQYDVGEIKE